VIRRLAAALRAAAADPTLLAAVGLVLLNAGLRSILDDLTEVREASLRCGRDLVAAPDSGAECSGCGGYPGCPSCPTYPRCSAARARPDHGARSCSYSDCSVCGSDRPPAPAA
jgi:hypothetical protein